MGLPPGSERAFEHPDIIRTLYAAALHLNTGKARSAGPKPENTGQRWTADEEEELKQAFHNGVDFRDMALAHKRTRKAVTRRLEFLGLLEPLDT
ncbi:MAG: hypothetical protein AAF337_08030 [Pseudomonadota bacterium]